MKRIIATVLLLALVLTMAPRIFASEESASGTCGKSATWTFSNDTLTVNGTGAVQVTYPFPWNAYRKQIEHLVVEEGITELGSTCFMELNNLQTVELPDSLITIGGQVFQSCELLTEITVPKNVAEIGDSNNSAASTFSAANLQKIHVAAENERFYSMDGVLFDRYSNTLLCCPRGKTGDEYVVPGDIRHIGYGAFWHSTLKAIVLPEGLQTIDDSAFFGADFTAIEIPGTVTSIGSGAFENCGQLTAITIPKSVEKIERYAFASCQMLTEIKILNPECAIAANANAIEEDAVIYGYGDSTAQSYALRFGRNFVDIATGQQYTYNQGNAAYIALLPAQTGGSAPSFNSISMFSDETGEITGYQPHIVLELDTSNATYQEMLAFVNDLTKSCVTDYEKAQKISAWVNGNMTYVFGHWGQGETPEGVYDIWQKRRGNCEGYTQLTNFMLHLVGIPTATVTSYDHTWTAALIGGKWIMIDSTNDIFDAPSDSFDAIVRICFAVNDNIVCVIDDLSGVKLASYGRSILDHAEVTEITIPSYITHIYYSTFFCEYNSAVTTHLTIKGTAGSYAESYLKENLPHYNDYTYDGDMFIARVGKVLTEDAGVTVSCDHAYGAWSNAGNSHQRACSKCGGTESAAHTWDAGTVTKDATCKAEGTKTMTCTVCGTTSTKSIAKTNNHTWGASFKVDGGSHKHSCSVCGKEEVSGHTWNGGKITKEATCKEEGVMTYTCTACDATSTKSIAKTNKHTWGASFKVDGGSHKHSCSVCGKEEVSGHTWNGGKITKEATCKEAGVMTYTCTACDAAVTESIAKRTVHTYDHDCDPECNVCGASRETTHVYDTAWSWDEANHWHGCTVCGTANSPVAHDFDNECATICPTCGYIRENAHVYPPDWQTDENGHWKTCRICGTLSEIEAHIPGGEATEDTAQVCTLCDYELVPALGHSFGESWSSDEENHWHECACGARVDQATHSWNDGEENKGRSTTYTCSVCGARRTEESQGLSPAVWTALIAGLFVMIGGGVIVFFIRKKKQ